ncbi:hypothetical protein HO173_005299 [Letharia columbiana]|uniref:Uncharacterized protein n=1 Tax=Letharia columbiana TaxID=112416 RepID=A0A8H6FX95_9LECA|nr:uncharacterized protein HO173_005299 [Letharia columbiana]KAF6236518.1 hypothetical protein HO173_005299 [Letharia columbiana]
MPIYPGSRLRLRLYTLELAQRPYPRRHIRTMPNRPRSHLPRRHCLLDLGKTSDSYFQCENPSGLSPASSPSIYSPGTGSTSMSPDAERKNNWGKRFAGNMLIGHGVRASTTTITSSEKLPINVSPMGRQEPSNPPKRLNTGHLLRWSLPLLERSLFKVLVRS